MSILAEDVITEAQPPAGDETATSAGKDAGAAAADGWERDGRGRAYVKAPEGHPAAKKGGNVYRRGEETVDQALERAGRPDADKKPPKPRAKKLPKRETNEPDLKMVEEALGQIFQAPGQVAGMMLQDQWLYMHFRLRGPELARALVNAAEHNPWLRKKLLELAAGGAAAMQLQAIVLLAMAAGAYVVPPLAYMLGWEINPIIQAAVLGGPIPQRPRPAPVAQPAPADTTPHFVNVDEEYAEGSPQAASGT